MRDILPETKYIFGSNCWILIPSITFNLSSVFMISGMRKVSMLSGKIILSVTNVFLFVPQNVFRSSRLSLQYRVIYTVKCKIITVFVLEISPHEY